MFKTTKFLFVTALATLLHAPAFGEPLQYIGPSNTSAPGNQGPLLKNQFCDDTFPGSQFCSSLDVLRGGGFPGPIPPIGTPDLQWVAPDIIAMERVPPTLEAGVEDFFLLDASGTRGSLVTGGAMSCEGWTSEAANRSGLAINRFGGFFNIACDFEVPTACCIKPPTGPDRAFP